MIDVSIIIPAYNAEQYIKECIDSVLAQETKYSYEVIVCDDGSTDNTYQILCSYTSEKMKIFKVEHIGIVGVLNLLLLNARGEYIMRMDADDVMLPNRVEFQMDYLKSHPNIDLLGGGRIFMKNGAQNGNHGFLKMEHFFKGNVVVHPTIVFKSSLNVRYKDDYKYAEDMYLYYELLCDNKVLYLDPTPVILYREEQETNYERAKLMWDEGQRVAELFKAKHAMQNCQYPLDVKLNDRSKDLTCIITSRNEGDEVRKTVESIRKTAPDVKVIIIDDASDDGYDYAAIANDYNDIRYVRNPEAMGVAKSRDIGVDLTETEYFVLLDGHMRFYNKYWDTLLVQAIIDHPRCIMTANTIVMRKEEDGKIVNEDGSDYNVRLATGAFINPDEPSHELTSKWAKHREGECLEISSIMGAVYASTVYWWKYIRGLEGLKNYGNDESLIAIKTWLLGGKCYVLNNWGVGHLYRNKHPYQVQSHLYVYNKVLLVELFIDDEKRKAEIWENHKKTCSQGNFTLMKEEIEKSREWINEMKQYIKDRQVISFDQFMTINKSFM